jgi:alpha-glucoside transport system permease protein
MTQAQAPVAIGAQVQTRRRARPRLGGLAVNTVLLILMILWAIPAIGLLVASFRTAADTNASGWWTAFTPPWEFTIANYEYVLGRAGIDQAFINSFVITIPATVLVVMIAAFAAYAFAWMEFPGRNILFVIVVGLLVVPLQITLIPVLNFFRDFTPAGIKINGTFLAVWLAHTGYGLPFAIYLLRNYFGGLPKEVFESAAIDGAAPGTAFFRLALPMSVPALASLIIFQFLWLWNDLLVALVYLGPVPQNHPLSVVLANLTTSFGGGWQFLTAAAFVSMIVPIIVFLSLQRYFVRGITGGAVKG